MTRKLPWKRASETSVKPELRSPATPTPGPSSRASPLHSRGRTPQTAARRVTPASVGHAYQPGRSPSTSPPPQPISERFMTEGREFDDQYRMVEDEFVIIAGQFTAHLHRAEYERLKTQTRSQNAETIASIARPVTGSLTEIARKRQENVLRKRKQTEALRKAKSNAGIQDDLSGDEGDAPWEGTALHGLMESRGYDQVPLTGLIRTSAAAGPSQRDQRRSSTASPNSSPAPKSAARPSASVAGAKRPLEDDIETESDEDDLDASVSRRPRNLSMSRAVERTPSTRTVPGSSASAPQRKHSMPQTLPTRTPQSGIAGPSSSGALPRRRTEEATSTPSKAPAASAIPKDSSDSEEDPFASFMKSRRRNDRDRRRPVKKEEKKVEGKKNIPDIIPTWLV